MFASRVTAPVVSAVNVSGRQTVPGISDPVLPASIGECDGSPITSAMVLFGIVGDASFRGGLTRCGNGSRDGRMVLLSLASEVRQAMFSHEETGAMDVT
jgi:hypothetical protein